MNTALISIFDTNSSVHDPSDLILFFCWYYLQEFSFYIGIGM